MQITITNLIGQLIIVGNDVPADDIAEKVKDALTKAIESATKVVFKISDIQK